MAYEDKAFNPSTGSMIPSHTETQIKGCHPYDRSFKFNSHCFKLSKENPRETAEAKHVFYSGIVSKSTDKDTSRFYYESVKN